MLRLMARGAWTRAVLASSIAALGLIGAANVATAQTEWMPFAERDEQARRNRAKQAPLPPPLSTVDPNVLRQQPGAPSAGDARAAPFGAPYPGTEQAGAVFTGPQVAPSGRASGGSAAASVERIELAPLDPPAAGAAATPAAPTRGVATPIGPQPVGSQPVSLATSQNAFGSELWRGIDMRQLEELIAPLGVPPRSIAMHRLWSRLLASDVAAPAGGKGPTHFLALQLEALHRSGLIDGMTAKLGGGEATDPLLIAFKIRRDLAAGSTEAVCAAAKALSAKRGEVPKLLKGEAHLLAGYCAAVNGNPSAAGLAAELAREDEVEAPLALAALDAIALQGPAEGGGGAAAKTAPPRLQLPKKLLVLDYRLLERLGPIDPAQVLDKAEPALLVAMATSKDADPRSIVLAAEAAATVNALTPERLGEIYAGVATPAAAAGDGVFRRADLYKAIQAEAAPVRRLALMRQLLDDARRVGLYVHVARMLAKSIATIAPSPEVAAAAETAAEIALVGEDFQRARQFALLNPVARHWLALIDITDPLAKRDGNLEQALAGLDDLARRGRIGGPLLHRLATVLDALDVNVPLPLWEAASRTPQPTTGHLPDTGVLPLLADAAKKREIGRTALLVMRTLGPSGPDGAHMIALGDSIRALGRAGLDADARAVAFEALFAAWPRGG